MATHFQLKYPKNTFKQDRYYRLDLVYAISIENDRFDPKYPYKILKVMFSEFDDQYQNLNNIKNIPEKDFFKRNKVSKDENSEILLKVDVTNHLLLEPGTVWKNGRVVWGIAQSKNVEIRKSEQKPQIISFQQAKEKNINFPFLPMEVYQSNLLMIPNCIMDNKEITLLIPTMEVIRNCYLGSNFLTMQLYNGGFQYLEGKKSPTTFRYDPMHGTRKCYIWLRRKCYDTDAIVIAQAIKSDVACNAMRYVYSSINLQRNNGKTILYPKTFFPFQDSAELEVQGQWLPPDEYMNYNYFFVRSIQKTHYELPFDKLIIESIDSYKGKNNKTGKKIPKIISDTYDDPEDKPLLTYDEPPNEALDKEELEFYMSRFDHLEHVSIEKVQKATDSDKSVFEHEEIETSDDSTLPGNYHEDNDIQPWQVRVVEASPVPISKRFEMVSKAVLNLVNNNQINAVALPEGEVDQTSPFGLYSFRKPFDKSGNYKWHMLNDGTTKRRALFIKMLPIDTRKSSIYLLEIEGKGSATFSLFLMRNVLPESLINDQRYGAKSFLQEIAKRSGKKINSQVLSKNFGVVISMKHVETDDDSFTNKLTKAIRDLLKEK